jgi:hypothetical protein
MRLLFVHQNFPGSTGIWRPTTLRGRQRSVAIGETRNLRRFAGVNVLGYRHEERDGGNSFENPVLRAIRRAGPSARRGGAAGARRVPARRHLHPHRLGRGAVPEGRVPAAKVLLYCEFFYRARGADLGFDPEFPPAPRNALRLRVMNAPC